MELLIDGVRYNIEVTGEGEPLLLLHGFTGSLKNWEFLIPIMGNQYKLIRVDIIGHGDTDKPLDHTRYSVQQVSKDLKSILDHLNIEKANILGYSMGGRLALSFACLYPEYVTKLILESASPGLESSEQRQLRIQQDENLAGRIMNEGVASFVDYWESILLFASQKKLSIEEKQFIKQQRLANSKIGLANSLRGMGTGIQPSWWQELSKLSFPVLLLTGELDEKFCVIAGRMQKLIKQCEWQVITNAGHAVHVEDRRMFGKIVSEFLNS
ncbi:2-succinyl-6-hydroxy-2,4-cyclohexadiene-1-carboxylate synthase [Peribacillus sp. SCS-155]|uniref:2-succinyl-6-hydroxy-2, 4-cyclohexadiene-1-carboxylate synthase n=1 Tax=Peribacillus sedimenti TaxID=3115297 RepID=UPI003905ED02